jgi:hypothetical protein
VRHASSIAEGEGLVGNGSSKQLALSLISLPLNRMWSPSLSSPRAVYIALVGAIIVCASKSDNELFHKGAETVLHP